MILSVDVEVVKFEVVLLLDPLVPDISVVDPLVSDISVVESDVLSVVLEVVKSVVEEFPPVEKPPVEVTPVEKPPVVELPLVEVEVLPVLVDDEFPDW